MNTKDTKGIRRYNSRSRAVSKIQACCFVHVFDYISENTSANVSNTSTKKKSILLGCVLANGGKANNGRFFGLLSYCKAIFHT